MSLRARLLAAFTYSLLVVVVALEVPLANNLAQRVDAEVEAEAASQAQILAAAASRRLDQLSYLDRLADRSAQQIGGRVVIVDSQGRLRADSAGAGSIGAVYATDQRPELIQALDRQVSQGQRHSDSLDEDLLVTAVPVLDGDRVEGAVRVTQAVGAVNSEV
jgi:sensor histidine kinase regulating citrate/malate metabolism